MPSPDLSRWLETVPRVLRNRFVKVGLLDSKRVAGNKPLLQHVDEFVASLRAAGRSKDYIEPVECRIRRIITDCDFQTISDIQGSVVQECLATLKKVGTKPRKADDTDSKPVGPGQRTVKLPPLSTSPLDRESVAMKATGTDDTRQNVLPVC